jgi:hypothetical protein
VRFWTIALPVDPALSTERDSGKRSVQPAPTSPEEKLLTFELEPFNLNCEVPLFMPEDAPLLN